MAVTAKVDCRVFCHINSLGDKISNTAAPIQPNSFWFWEKSRYIFMNKLGRLIRISPAFRSENFGPRSVFSKDNIFILYLCVFLV